MTPEMQCGVSHVFFIWKPYTTSSVTVKIIIDLPLICVVVYEVNEYL